MKKVLSTKTLDPDTLKYAQTQHLAVVCMDVIDIRPLAFSVTSLPINSMPALAFTSANAVKYFLAHPQLEGYVKNKPVFALAGKTTSQLALWGIQPVITANDAAELATEITKAGFKGHVLHICGTLRLPVLENKLKKAGIGFSELHVYETVPSPAQKINALFDAILFFSPSGVEAFTVNNALPDETIYCCIGSTTATALKEKKSTIPIITPVQSSPRAMITALVDYWKQQSIN